MYHNVGVIKCRRSAGLQTGNKTSGHYGNIQFGKLRAWREFLAVQLASHVGACFGETVKTLSA